MHKYSERNSKEYQHESYILLHPNGEDKKSILIAVTLLFQIEYEYRDLHPWMLTMEILPERAQKYEGPKHLTKKINEGLHI